MKKLFWPFERKLLKRTKFYRPPKHANANDAPLAIITGGSEGIGLALARAAAELSMNLLLIARDQDKLLSTKNTIETVYPGTKVHILSQDLAKQDATQNVTAYLQNHNLQPQLLFNNVSIGHLGPFAEADPKQIQQLIDLNMRCFTQLTLALLPDMLKRRNGGIVNISSIAGELPGPYQATYYATKAYTNSLTQAISHENLFSGVHIAVVTPGPVSTKFHERIGSDNAFYLYTQTVISPETVARSTFIWFALRRRFISPGLINSINTILIRIVPYSLLLIITGILLKGRRKPE